MDASLRWAGPSDYDALGRLMYDAVRLGPGPYTEAQRSAWVASPRHGPDWTARLDAQRVRVAEAEGRLVAFMSLEPPGHLDFAYVHPDARGRGLFRRLFADVEDEARRHGADVMQTEASLMARGPMEAVGFEIVREETVETGGESLRRFVMRRPLPLHANRPVR